MQMNKVRPFKAFVYSQSKIKNLSKVVCPPYDVISGRQQEAFLDQDPYNYVHILLRKDVPGEDKYQKASENFREWIKEKILIQDDSPAIYFYGQQYSLRGEKKTRLGFIALLRLAEEKSSVFGHEHTRIEPKEDRLRLIRSVKANLSPIFVIFSDKERIIRRIYQKIQNDKPFIEVTDADGIRHTLWRIDSGDLLKDMQLKIQDEKFFIADGHHRYEVACIYRDEIRQKLKNVSGEESFNYILAYFTNTDMHGLTIMPIHRLVKLSSGFDIAQFSSKISEYFDIEPVKDKARFFLLMQKAADNHVIGVYSAKRFWLLRLKNIKILDKIISDKPKAYRMLDVSILNYIILQKAFGLDIEDKHNIKFCHDSDELMRDADSDPNSAVFLLNPVKIEQIMSLALEGQKMPSKSTYFYPKVLSGLVVHKFEEEI